MTVTLEAAWVALLFSLFSVGAAILGWYIRLTVERATRTINQRNDGSHIVDRVARLEKNVDLLVENQKIVLDYCMGQKPQEARRGPNDS